MVTTPGTESGTTIRKKNPSRLAPSIDAASSISFGMGGCPEFHGTRDNLVLLAGGDVRVARVDEPRGRRGPVKLRPEIVSFIRDGAGGSGELVEQVADRFGVRLHRRTVERVRGR